MRQSIAGQYERAGRQRVLVQQEKSAQRGRPRVRDDALPYEPIPLWIPRESRKEKCNPTSQRNSLREWPLKKNRAQLTIRRPIGGPCQCQCADQALTTRAPRNEPPTTPSPPPKPRWICPRRLLRIQSQPKRWHHERSRSRGLRLSRRRALERLMLRADVRELA